jgi:hypothetical protein
MRNFAYQNPDYIKNEVVPDLIEDNPCYQKYVYDTVMYDESLDGDLIQCDMTQILLNQEKYRRLLGDMNVQDILAQMHPTQSTIMDGMTDFPQPAFDQLGMQAVPALNLQNNPGRNVSGSLGYNLRYWQWKSNIDTSHSSRTLNKRIQTTRNHSVRRIVGIIHAPHLLLFLVCRPISLIFLACSSLLLPLLRLRLLRLLLVNQVLVPVRLIR